MASRRTGRQAKGCGRRSRVSRSRKLLYVHASRPCFPQQIASKGVVLERRDHFLLQICKSCDQLNQLAASIVNNQELMRQRWFVREGWNIKQTCTCARLRFDTSTGPILRLFAAEECCPASTQVRQRCRKCRAGVIM
jgi:hypothetical protein